MSTYSKEYYHYITAIATIPTDTILWAHDENKGLTTFQAQWSSNPSQEALTLFLQMNYFTWRPEEWLQHKFREDTAITISALNYQETYRIDTNKLLLPESTNGGTCHGRLACEARRMPIN